MTDCLAFLLAACYATATTQTGVAMLPASRFGMSPSRMITRMAYVDFKGEDALNVSALHTLHYTAL